MRSLDGKALQANRDVTMHGEAAVVMRQGRAAFRLPCARPRPAPLRVPADTSEKSFQPTFQCNAPVEAAEAGVFGGGDASATSYLAFATRPSTMVPSA